VLVYIAGCNSRVCYNTGIDGFEPIRVYSFFLTEGLALAARGFSVRTKLSGSETLIAKIATFYSITYYPVIFTISGAKLGAQISPLPVLIVAILFSFATSASVLEKSNDWRVGLALPPLTFLLLSVVSIGIASQYVTQILPLLGILLVCTLGASLLGVLISFRRREIVRRLVNSRALTIGLIGLILLTILIIPPDAVTGTAPSLTTKSYYFQAPVIVGGFMSDPSVGTKGVSANFSFEGTNISGIQKDNFLAAGIGIHSPNCCVDGIDYGYRADIYLYHNASEVFAASAWEVCDVIIACGGHPWKNLIFFSSEQLSATVADNFQLSMKWMNHTVSWFYAVANESRLVASFQVPLQENPGFNAGWLGISSTPSSGGFPFFQFGMMSSFPIDHAGWRVTISCPSILVNSTWICVNHAELLQGDQSLWKAIWRWGEPYSDVGATIDQEAKNITFKYSQATVQSFETAW